MVSLKTFQRWSENYTMKGKNVWPLPFHFYFLFIPINVQKWNIPINWMKYSHFFILKIFKFQIICSWDNTFIHSKSLALYIAQDIMIPIWAYKMTRAKKGK